MQFGQQTHYRGNILMVLASVAAIASAAGAIWGLERADSGLTNIEDATQNMATDMLTVREKENHKSFVDSCHRHSCGEREKEPRNDVQQVASTVAIPPNTLS